MTQRDISFFDKQASHIRTSAIQVVAIELSPPPIAQTGCSAKCAACKNNSDQGCKSLGKLKEIVDS